MQLEYNRIIAIDPGSNGGIAVLEYPSKEVILASRLPDNEMDRLAIILRAFSHNKEYLRPYVALERVGTIFPRSKISPSPKSMFTFGMGYGLLRGMLLTSGYQIQDVLPNEWQGELSCKTKGDKNITKNLAIKLFPDIKITHAIADALLIAHYAYLKIKNT